MYSQCRHIMPSGARCKSPALHDKPYCYFHTSLQRYRNAPKGSENEPFDIPVLEDSSAIQIALSQVLTALGTYQLDSRRAGLFLYGLQIASQVTARPSDRVPADSIRSVCNEADGEDLAPEKSVCEIPKDCRTCPTSSDCERGYMFALHQPEKTGSDDDPGRRSE
jgi:hypothetical protein